MCGIFGLIIKDDSDRSDIQQKVDCLFKLSESRGKDASGLSVVSEENIKVLKSSISASKFIKTAGYKSLFLSVNSISALIGHARMETDGSYSKSFNNQPVVKDGCITVHNGIVVNQKALWKKYKNLKKEYEVDTEIINSLLRYNLDSLNNKVDAVGKTLNELEGSYSIGTLFDDFNALLLATNTGSLYLIEDKSKELIIFASERYFAEQFLSKQGSEFTIVKIEPQNGLFIDIESLDKHYFQIDKASKVKFDPNLKKRKIEILKVKSKQDFKLMNIIRINQNNIKDIEKLVNQEYEKNYSKIKKLKRCTRCILPETMPFIEFDDDGICNYCHNYEKGEVKGKKSLLQELKKYDLDKKKNNCIVAFSGGRDSSYALHYAKKELGLNPLAFSYDWGMITDLGRRNQARMTGQLGVEHILISADIKQKRENICRNVTAWLKKPHLGTVPLFMAGDKQYFYYLNKLKKDYGIDLVIYASNNLERTDFKYGFADVKTGSDKSMGYKQIYKMKAIKLLAFYIKQFIGNPALINSSLLDTFGAYISSFFVKKDHLYLYSYIGWDEKKIEDTLVKRYDWELAEDTNTSWRIGDGTAAFYNYIYYTMAGFTENDTFRSNQIREGLLTREKAVELATEGNEPRIESMIWYANTIGLDLRKAVESINKARKLY